MFHVEGTFTYLDEDARKENSQTDSESSAVEKGGLKRPCTIYFLRNHGLITLASKFKELNPVMVEPIISLFQVLIEDLCAVDCGVAADQDLVLGVTAFLQSMMTFNIIGRASEHKFCEFMFSTASMMKVYDGLLLSWFQMIEKVAGAPALGLATSKTWENVDSNSSAQTLIDNGYHREFPLFCLLLNYVHHGGKSGEYSRTGLLYLIEVASESEALVNWVLKSDLSSLMASGLCALYSQLSRTIQQPDLNHEPKDRFDQKDLSVFLSYLLFWQDMLTFAQKSASLTKNLVYHFDVLFVRQLLYNSIVESTDFSGGYSDSLLSILTSILETLNHDLLSQAIVCYFIGHPVSYGQAIISNNTRPPSSISLYSFKQGSPILKLGDVICSTLAADDSSKRVHALRLCSVLFSKYYPYTMDTLIPIKRSIPTNGGSLKTLTVVQSVCKSVLSDIMDSVTMNGKVDQYKRDIELMAERTPFPSPSLQKRYLAEELVRLETSGQILLKRNYPQYTLRMHQIQEQDLSNSDRANENLITLILGKLLPSFFTNSISENLTLTLIIIELGTCGWLNLEGWATQVLLEVIEQLRGEYMEITGIIEGFEGMLDKLKQEMGSNDPELQKEEFSDDEPSSLRVVKSEETAIASRHSSFRDWIPSPLRAKELVTRSFSVISHLSVRSMVFSDDEDGAQDSGNETTRDLHGNTPNVTCSINDGSDEPEGLSKQGSQDQLLDAIDIKGISIQLMDFCTNALILQDFVCELMALYQVRFWLFDNH